MDPFEFLDRYLADLRRHLALESLLESIAVLAVSVISIVAVSVAALVLSPGFQVVRWVSAAAVIGVTALSTARLWVRVRRTLADPVGLGFLIARRVPGLGPGLAATLSLRTRLDEPGGPPFSAALLHAEALRDIRVLADHPPENLVHYRRSVRLVLVLAGLLAALAILCVAFPWSVARGVRDLTGLSERFTPSWLIGPPAVVDYLAYDLRTTMLLEQADRGVERVPGDETGDVSAPAGCWVEVAGRLSVPAASGTLVVEAGGHEAIAPIVVLPGGSFQATFRVTQPGAWHVAVATPDGGRLVEAARRRVMIEPEEPPKVTVEKPERLGLRPGETASVRYRAESPSGIGGVDALYLYPMDPTRPPVRVHVADLAPGTRMTSGEVVFTMPADAVEADGRVDLAVEVFGRPAGAAGSTGRAENVRFHVDSPRFRHVAVLDDADHLLLVLLGLVGSLDDTGCPADAPPGEDAARRVRMAAAVAKRLADDVHADEEATPSLVEAIAVASAGLAASDARRPCAEMSTRIDGAVLALDAGVSREWAAQLRGRLADIAVEAGRLRAETRKLPEDDRAPDDVRREVAKARRLLRQADLQRRRLAWAGPTGGAARVEAARLADVSARAGDAVATADVALVGEDGRAAAPAMLRAAAAMDEFVRALRRDESRWTVAVDRQVTLPAEIGALLRTAISVQRDVMERTGQAAFDLKRREESLAGGRMPETGRLLELVQDARSQLERVAPDRLDAADASEVASMREDVGAVVDLLEERDLDTALRVLRELSDRTAVLAAQLRDQSDWGEDQGARDAAGLRLQAARLGRAAGPMRDALRSLAAWKKDKESAVGPTEREALHALKADEDKALAQVVRLHETLRRAGGSSDEPTSAAGAARRNIEEASRRLAEFNPAAAEAHQRQAVQDLLRLKRALEHGGEEAAVRRRAAADDDDVVRLPAPTAQRPSDELRRELHARMKEPALTRFTDLVKAYYDAILRP